MLSHTTSLRVRGILLLHNRGAKPKTAAIFICPFSPKNSRMPPKIVAEYAKSGRSSCKKCGGAIAAKAPRLGLVVRDARGFDIPKWHHLQCFSDRIDSVAAITGYDSFKDVDQEALKKLVDASNKSPEQVIEKGDSSVEVEIEQKIKRTGIEASQTIGVVESGSKKIKLSTSTQKVEFELSFSVSATKDKYKDALLLPKWKAFETIIFLERDDGLHDSRKIAAFDFDGCLAKTSVKRVGADAWSLMYPSIPEQLQKLYSDGYKLVIFTNESNIERWKNKRQVAVDSKIGRLNNFIKKVKVPMQVFIACGFDSNDKGEDPFRKPKPGMWHIMEKYFNSDIPIDMDQSFYVGDAAGRENDHSDADIKFAQIEKQTAYYYSLALNMSKAINMMYRLRILKYFLRSQDEIDSLYVGL